MKKTISIVLVLTLGLVTEVAKADFTFGEPINLGPTVNSSADDVTLSISGDGLELYFSSDLPGGEGSSDIWVLTRPTTADDWGEPVNLGPTVNRSSSENSPNISADGLTLYFAGDVLNDESGVSGGAIEDTDNRQHDFVWRFGRCSAYAVRCLYTPESIYN